MVTSSGLGMLFKPPGLRVCPCPRTECHSGPQHWPRSPRLSRAHPFDRRITGRQAVRAHLFTAGNPSGGAAVCKNALLARPRFSGLRLAGVFRSWRVRRSETDIPRHGYRHPILVALIGPEGRDTLFSTRVLLSSEQDINLGYTACGRCENCEPRCAEEQLAPIAQGAPSAENSAKKPSTRTEKAGINLISKFSVPL